MELFEGLFKFEGDSGTGGAPPPAAPATGDPVPVKPVGGTGDPAPVTPTAPVTPDPVTPTAPTAVPVPKWTDGFDDDMSGWVTNKGFDSAKTVVQSYRNLEKLTGAGPDKLLKIPEDMTDKVQTDPFFAKLGRPETADKYDLPMPEKTADPAFKEWAQNVFHGVGLSTTQAKAITEKWNEFAAGQGKTTMEAANVKLLEQEQALKREWGVAYDENVALAKKAALAFKIQGPEMEALEASLGMDRVFKLFHGLGTKIGEDPFVTGDQSTGFSGVMTPAQARSRINVLSGDAEFTKRYLEGGVAERTEMERLHKMSSPEPSVN